MNQVLRFAILLLLLFPPTVGAAQTIADKASDETSTEARQEKLAAEALAAEQRKLVISQRIWPEVFGGASIPMSQTVILSDIRIDADTRRTVIERVVEVVKQFYLSSETASRMEKALREHESRGDYDNIKFGPALAEILTFHLRQVSDDQHVYVGYSLKPLPEEKSTGASATSDDDQYAQSARRQNCGFEKVERLSGNVGYLDLRGFYRATVARDTAVAAMTFLADTDALIIDLRRNGGGNPSMVALLSTYFFAGDPVHLADIFWRQENRTEQVWTLPDVPGKRYGAKPVYILTSNQTFSAAEGFAYFLKTLKRATIVGEPTAGAANPGRSRRIAEHFEINVPSGQVTSPITKTNWEGSGVLPDIDVPSGAALEAAHLDALKKIADSEKDARRLRDLNAFIVETSKSEAEAHSRLPQKILPSVVGNTQFRLKQAAFARNVALVGSFNNWDASQTICAREGEDWVCRVELSPGRYNYKFVMDGIWIIDPLSRNMDVDQEGRVSSVITK